MEEVERHLLSRYAAAVRHSRQRPASLAAGAFVLVVLVILLGYVFNWEWTGLGSSVSPTTYHPEKTLWDWMQLFIIPAVLAVGTVWFTKGSLNNYFPFSGAHS